MDVIVKLHLDQLKRDYDSMVQLPGPVITWEPIGQFHPPHTYPEQYRVVYNILAPTVNGNANRHVLEIDCRAPNYPFTLPIARFTTPVLKHPHVWEPGSARYPEMCTGGMPLSETLAMFCVRLGGFFLYDKTLIYRNSIASRQFEQFYDDNRNRLPLAHVVLPVITGASSSFRKMGTIRRPDNTGNPSPKR